MFNSDKEIFFPEFVCTSDSHCGIYSDEGKNDGTKGLCNKTTGECECKNGLRFNGLECVGKVFTVSWQNFNKI